MNFQSIAVYNWTGPLGSGSGNIDITHTHPLLTHDTFREVEEEIRRKKNFTSVVITNIIPLHSE